MLKYIEQQIWRDQKVNTHAHIPFLEVLGIAHIGGHCRHSAVKLSVPGSPVAMEDAALLVVMGPALTIWCDVATEIGESALPELVAPEGHRLWCGGHKIRQEA